MSKLEHLLVLWNVALTVALVTLTVNYRRFLREFDRRAVLAVRQHLKDGGVL